VCEREAEMEGERDGSLQLRILVVMPINLPKP
jgi:hypothetical protein